MNPVGKVSVFPRLPASLARLNELAYNLWWSWEAEAQELFARIDPQLWSALNHNPVRLLRSVSQDRLNVVASDHDYAKRYAVVMDAFDSYMDPAAESWFSRNHADRRESVIAYFSAEFGLHEALPIYSGGLGILSGDHCKSASDLGLPFVGVGFLYPQGYFTQRIDADGRQQAEYEKIDFSEVPAKPALDPTGREVLINVDLPGRTVYAKIWRIQVGRVPVYLMDTDVPRNAPQDRELSARLYGGDREMRISQEVVLGIGGVRAVRALGYKPAVWHMNEGHSAFLGLERIRELVQGEGLTFDEGVEAVRADTLFTTHTPVPAGNDSFAFELVEKFFWQYWEQLGIDRERFIGFARQELEWGAQYSMTVLALHLSAYHNGVSELHGDVSRRMWNFLWPGTPVEQTPIGHITNGVHTKTWLVSELNDLYSRYLPVGWRDAVEEPATWQGIDAIPDGELWHVHQVRKEKLVELVRSRVRAQYLRHGEGPHLVKRAATILDPRALILGFARRFATYKRATLIFRDEERLMRILDHPDRPVQILFSGKAHPADEPGKDLIQHIYQLSQQPAYVGKVVFVENYDMNIARHLISGVDVWLNNPRRPREASGTSGQKAALSGVPNFSVLDGWWREAYDGTNGWSIGEEREFKDLDTQDDADAFDLYTALEEELIPLFFERDEEGVPRGWVRRMKNSIRTCASRFSMSRMVIDYTNEYYMPAADSGNQCAFGERRLAHEIADWKARMRQKWSAVHLEALGDVDGQVAVGDSLKIGAKVWLHGIAPSDVAVEIVTGVLDNEGHLIDAQVVAMKQSGEESGALLYWGELAPTQSGRFSLGVRVRGDHPALVNPYEAGLIRWAKK